MFEAGCGFHVVWRAAARCRGDGVWLLFFRIFLLALAGFSFRGGDRELGNNPNEF